MRRAVLNLAALRASRATPRGDASNLADQPFTVSRRQALGLAGVAAVGTTPAMRAMERAVRGAYTVERTGNYRVAFLLGGQERWVIDTRLFAGKPRLAVTETDGRLAVELRDARYPGTDLAADLRAEIQQGVSGARIHITLALGGFDARARFERWLAGADTLRAAMHLPESRVGMGTAAALLLRGTVEATYSPDGTLALEGPHVASVQGLGGALQADNVQLVPLARTAPSSLAVASAKRTLFAVQAGSHAWRLHPAGAPNGRWTVVVPDAAFTSAHIEVGESSTGARSAAFVADAASTVYFQPHSGFRAVSGDIVSLGLSGARYAVAFDPTGDHASLLARFDATPTWLRAGACAVEVGDTPDAPLFELHARGGTVTKVLCTPAVLRVSVPLAGAVTEPAVQPAGTQLAFVTTGLERPGSAHAAQITLSDHPTESFQRFTLINLRLSVLRPIDMMAMTFEFINMKLDSSAKGKPPVFVPRPVIVARSNKIISRIFRPSSFLAVHMQGQNIAEQAFFRVEGAPNLALEFPEGQPHLVAQTRMADESRLVFALPANVKSLPLTLNTLLDWAQLDPSVPATALPAGERTKAKIVEPTSTETSLEIPWRLKISPNRFSTWLHSFAPVTHNGRTELWHTRLGVKVVTTATAQVPAHTYLVDQHYAYEAQDSANGRKYVVTRDVYANGKPIDLTAGLRTIRAVWSQDFPQAKRLAENVPFRMSLTGQERYDLVRLTTDFSLSYLKSNLAIVSHRGYLPKPVQVDRLMLTTLGAWVDMRGAWSDGVRLGIAVEEWRHRGTQGRDNYVRIVIKGYLFPFGHRASLVINTERKFYLQGGRNIAYLFQRMFIIVREPIKTFGNSGLHDADGRSIDRAMPFKQVQITTVTTPDLDPAAKIDPSVGISSTDAFWPRRFSQDFLFHLIGQDQDGQRTDFTAPLAFISVEALLAFKHDPMKTVRDHYENDGGPYPDRRTRSMNGKKIAFAPSKKPGDTTLHATDITFDAFIPPDSTSLPDDQPRFFPIVAASTVSIPAVEALLHSGQKPQIKLSDHYLKNDLGGGANVGEVFAEILDAAKPKVAFGGGDSGGTGTPGVVTPNLAISALSRVLGPVGGDMVDQVASGNVPDVGAFLSQFFDSDAKILGAVPLSAIIKLPDLTPIFQVLSLIQAVENTPDTLNQLIQQAIAKLQQNLATLKAQALAALQTELAPLHSALSAIKGPLNSLHSALNSIPGPVKSLLGDNIDTLITDLGKVITDLTTVIGDLDTLLNDLGTANVGALQGDVNALTTPFTSLPKDLKTVVDDLSHLDGINPLPRLAHGQLPTALETTLTWSPHLQDFGPFKHLDKFLTVSAHVRIPFDGSAPEFDITGTLGKIGLDLLNIIYVGFGGLVFKAGSGQKPDVTAGDVIVKFEGPLQFLNDLKDIIPAGGFSDPPFLDITASGISAGFTFGLPSIGVGIFSLENISFGAKVTIPFIGSSPAQVYFNFCTREHPFLLTVSLLGGGGFFGISLGLDGLDMMEAAFEFGAELSLDFGIASGSVSIMAGIYFKMQKSPDQTILTGFVHIHGEVEALEILSVSIDVELDLTYEKDGKDTKVMGDAKLTISVHVLFFSVTVSASVHREFSGSHNDPTFLDQVSEPHWNEYLAAFA